MRESPRRHPLAVLRLFLELSQEEMADLAGCSRHTIQAVELEKLDLSNDLAGRLSAATGVSIKWLLDGDPSKAITDIQGSPYSKETFFSHSMKEMFVPQSVRRASRRLREWSSQQLALQLEAALNRADKNGTWELAKMMVAEFLERLWKETDKKTEATTFSAVKAATTFSSRWSEYQEEFGTTEPLKSAIGGSLDETTQSKRVALSKFLDYGGSPKELFAKGFEKNPNQHRKTK